MARSKAGSGPKTVTIPSSAATPDTGDRIFLHGLEVDCIIGFIEWERLDLVALALVGDELLRWTWQGQFPDRVLERDLPR